MPKYPGPLPLSMYSPADVRLTGNTRLVDDFLWTLSRNGVRADPFHVSFLEVRHPYLIIEVLRAGVGLGHFVLSLFANELARRWIMLRWLLITYREGDGTPTEWTIQGTPNQLIYQIRQMLWRNLSCPYCGSYVPLGRYCDRCGNRLSQ
jgi:hypothetical protein